jgi:pyrroline-5-carboxylate reductase
VIELLVVGGGKMGEALLGGLLAAGMYEPAQLGVVEVDAARREALRTRFVDVAVHDAPVAASAAVLAVKPQHCEAAAAALGALGVRRLLSIAAGVTLERLEAAAGADARVVRAMPNTPALVGAGAAAIAAGAGATDDDLAWAEQVLGAVGTVVRVPEAMLDAVTGVSGSGPAYVFLMAEALIAAGIDAGLPHEVSDALVRQTLLGAARLLAETGDDPAVLREAVTSPGGTTAAGLAVFEDAAFRALVRDVVAAATERSRELGRG